MLLILSHIQVMPSFLDIMFTFRGREDPHKWTKFSYETCLEKSQPRLTLPSLSKSGFRIQHCFNLIGVERDETQFDPWPIRQTAVYHSFDVAYHRSTWIVLKGNKLIRDRLQSSTAGYRKRFPDYPQTVQGCFTANLRSHMLIFQWSAENWGSYIEDLEGKLIRPRNVAKHGPVLELTKDERVEMNLKKNETWATLSSRNNTGFSDLTSSPSSPVRSGGMFEIFRSRSSSDSRLKRPSLSVSANPTSADGQTQDLDLNETFSFDHLQELHHLGSRVQEAINILARNKKLLQEVKQYFQRLIENKSFSSFVNLQAHTEDVAGFFHDIDKIVREMDSYQARLQDVVHDLEREKASEYALRTKLETTPVISMQQAVDYRISKKSGRQIDPEVDRRIQILVNNLQKRDHLFLIDDTDSMKEHSVQIVECFQTLAYIAKSLTPTFLELSFVSKPLPIAKDRNTYPLIKKLELHFSKYVSVQGQIESSLSTLITERIIKHFPAAIPLIGQVLRPKPITIFVFTDGKWGEGVQLGNGLDASISRLMRELRKCGLHRTHVMFQFLRFGNDERGREHLNYLHDFGGKEHWSVCLTLLFCSQSIGSYANINSPGILWTQRTSAAMCIACSSEPSLGISMTRVVKLENQDWLFQKLSS